MTDTIPCPPPSEETVEHGQVRLVEEHDDFSYVTVRLPKSAPVPSFRDEVELRWLSRAEIGAE